jgi:tryptophan-rich sensory protein
MKVLKLIASIIISFAAGAIGAIFTASAIPTWYATLIKPSFNPPSWLFAPAWSILYILMGIAFYLVWQTSKENKKIAYIAFFTQLVLNALWSIIFFGFHNLSLAFGEIVILWFAILWTFISFYKISRPASYLLIPYILWVIFAAILNFAILRLN